MKSHVSHAGKGNLFPGKARRVMRITAALVLFLSLQAAAAAFAQKITLSEDRASLREIFRQIKEQAGYNFLFNTEMLADARPVTVHVKDADINAVLEKCFAGQPLTYTINQNTIVVQRKTLVVADIGGKVTDEKGAPVPGARVWNQTTDKSVMTDEKGEFKIAASAGDKLVVKMMGYEDMAFTADGRTSFSLNLKPSTTALDAVVVVGYGTQKKANLTGAVSTVTAEDFAGRPVTSPMAALQGQMPGVTFQGSTGIPGGGDENNTKIRIRGVGTLNDPDPLVVVDGIPGGNLNILNPDDIETVTVLKDAASSSIYGVRGANGVILVTTKKGKGNAKPSLTYANYFGLQTPTALPTFLGSVDYMTLQNEAKVNAGQNPTFTSEQIETARNGSDPNYFANTKWIDEIYKKSAPQQSHMLNLSGGANNTNYYLSYSYLKQGGLVTGDNFSAKRHNVRLRVNTTVFDILQLDANIGYVDRLNSGSSAGVDFDAGPLYSAHQISPLIPVRFTNGSWGYHGGSQNPIAITTDGGTNKFSSQEITANLQATLNVTKDFRLRAQYGLVKYNSFREIFSKTINYYSPVDNSLIYQSNNPNKIDNRDYNGLFQTIIGMAEYEKKFNGGHYLKAMAAASAEENISRNFSATRTNLPTQEIGSINLGTLNQLNNSDAGQNALQSAFGRVNYSYNDKYLLEGNFRYDGSTRFAGPVRWNWFFSGSAGWVFSNESFFEPLKSVINFGKVRASYGTQGNDKVGNDFAYLSSINSVATMPIGNLITVGYRQTGVPNELLTWESVVKQDIGLDLAMLNSRLTVTADYFINNTNDILLKVPLPDVLGLRSAYPAQNAGKVQNKGWELMAGWQDHISDWSYGASFNISDVKNKVVSLGDAPSTPGERIRMVGYPIDAFYGYVAERIAQESDFKQENGKNVPLFPYNASFPMEPGDMMYKDLNGDGKITPADDRQVIGNAIPRYTYGFKGNAGYKGIDFSFFLQGVGKADGFISGAARHAFINESSNPQEIHLDRWTPENTSATYPRLAYGYSYNQQLSTFWLENAAYLRLKNVQVGYTLPRHLTQRVRAEKVRLYFSADNLLTKTDFFYGYDPETPLTLGGYYPQVKTFVFGLNVNFK